MSSTERIRPTISGPASGRMLRSFSLPRADGQLERVRDYLQRVNLVLFFHHGVGCQTCRDKLRELTAGVARFGEEEAAVLAIGSDGPAGTRQLAAELGCPYPLLIDPAGSAVAEQGLTVPALVVADRFGEIWAAWAGGEQHRLPSGQEIHEWLDLIELQCPECGVPEWPSLQPEHDL